MVNRMTTSLWWRHPIMPLIVFVLASKIIGEFYPFSPFSMYSNPSPVPLRFCYVTDGDEEPLPLLWHTGISPASLTKKYNTHRGEIEEALKKGERSGLAEEDIRAEAGLIALKWVRQLSYKRPKRELTGPVKLVEVLVGTDERGLVETERAVAELGADEGKEATP